MTNHAKAISSSAAGSFVDCGADPIGSIEQMFVGTVQMGRIQKGQCPAKRPVFRKPHGVARGWFKVRKDLPEAYKVGVFAGHDYPLWMRFSSDTAPTETDYLSTLGIGIKLFDVPGRKLIGNPDDITFDFIMQNMDVFFVDTAKDMCAFTKSGFDGASDEYLDNHPRTAEILDAMKKPVGSVLASPYWSIMAFGFGPDRYVKYKLEPATEDAPPQSAPSDPDYLAKDLAERLAKKDQRFTFGVQLRTNPDTMPLDRSTVAWPEDESPFVPVADIELPQQDITTRSQPEYGENFACNIWRVTEDHAPQGSIADARKVVYAASADLRRDANGIARGEPWENKGSGVFAPCAES